MRMSDWSSDVCSSDLAIRHDLVLLAGKVGGVAVREMAALGQVHAHDGVARRYQREEDRGIGLRAGMWLDVGVVAVEHLLDAVDRQLLGNRSEEHTSELQSLMRISYAVFCVNKNNKLL